ncbi:UDP-N-acetylmuramoyl-tripeptide--D-alanyl-D-alanine ligase [Microcoleus sp. FACHB-831]|uniref:UDP-N-acetylmuramoyl-tripeptide--D-alanyl-D- alanine ligase n=1 Tax=Microcoleus sp. FACHB-831 TaxID=2692827 RepID=UPI00168602E5|nr:UDP-N-acetylmuramoyl-tripeptide--D-alanyl-D-alanine ligase [Microcoleus sp. FACHB-831]MBD1924499.1 UDP-N-acetylmuramoyl-tripeptide--D-alanyl-D-alanine ligase [Microcoleus sp. FACHB-831]
MPYQFPLHQLKQVLAANVINLTDDILAKKATKIATDTRSLSAGDVFVALRGEKFDGHNFVKMAIEKGAIAVITDRHTGIPIEDNIPQFQVDDTLQAYQTIAQCCRDQFNIPVIAVTGSVGKTTTKELIAAVLSTRGRVLKTQANYNNEIGVPKTLLELGAEDDYAVIEMAMRARGEIALLTNIAHPTIGVITNVGTAHIGRLGSEEAIAQAKCELLAEMSPTGVAILNNDNKLLMQTAATVWQGRTITYGLEGGDLHGELIDSETLAVEGFKFSLPLAGRHNALNYLAALAVAKVLEIDWSQIAAGINVNLPEGRSKRYELANDVVILDETYNAGLESMIAALHLLAQTPGKRHIGVLGTMKELGERSPEFHRRVGETAAKLNLDNLLILVDDGEAEAIAVGAEGIPTERFATHAALVERLKEIVKEGDRLLFKASHSVGLDKVVNQFRTEVASSI